MAARNYRILFEVDVNQNQSRFRVPLSVLDLLRIPHNGSIALVIRNAAGRLLYGGIHPMRSKGEVYGADMNASISPGQTIFVVASRP
jgi:hypothetical protein